nr:uncharacterized protein LOC129387625 [Dermacentor andersoni]
MTTGGIIDKAALPPRGPEEASRGGKQPQTLATMPNKIRRKRNNTGSASVSQIAFLRPLTKRAPSVEHRVTGCMRSTSSSYSRLHRCPRNARKDYHVTCPLARRDCSAPKPQHLAGCAAA